METISVTKTKKQVKSVQTRLSFDLDVEENGAGVVGDGLEGSLVEEKLGKNISGKDPAKVELSQQFPNLRFHDARQRGSLANPYELLVPSKSLLTRHCSLVFFSKSFEKLSRSTRKQPMLLV